MTKRISVDPIFWWVVIPMGLVLLAVVIYMPFAIYYRSVRDDAAKKWCVDHGYSVAGISQTTSSGKLTMRIDQVMCMDDQRRMVFPGE